MDVRWNIGNRSVFTRRSHIQKTIAVQVADRRQRIEKEFYPTGRGVDGRLRKVLLRTDRQRPGENIFFSPPMLLC
jgi:hypothetical protein